MIHYADANKKINVVIIINNSGHDCNSDSLCQMTNKTGLDTEHLL